MKAITERFWCVAFGLMVAVVGLMSPSVARAGLKKVFEDFED